MVFFCCLNNRTEKLIFFFATTLSYIYIYIYKRLFKLTFLPGNVLRFNSIVIHISQKQNTLQRNNQMMKVTLGFIIRCQYIVKCVYRANWVVQMMNGKSSKRDERQPDVPFDIVSSRKSRNNCNYITELCYFLHLINDISHLDYGFCRENYKQIYRFEINLLQHNIEDDGDKTCTQTPSHFD